MKENQVPVKEKKVMDRESSLEKNWIYKHASLKQN